MICDNCGEKIEEWEKTVSSCKHVFHDYCCYSCYSCGVPDFLGNAINIDGKDYCEHCAQKIGPSPEEYYIQMDIKERRKESIDDDLTDYLLRQYEGDEIDVDSLDEKTECEFDEDLQFYEELYEELERQADEELLYSRYKDLLKEFIEESNKVRNHNFSGNYIKIASINPAILGTDIEIKGFIAKDLNDIIIYEVCQNCFKSVEDCDCNRGENTIFHMLINLIIDDGTGAISIIFLRDLAEELIKINTKNVLLIKGLPEYEKLLEKLSSLLLGQDIIIKGKVKLIRQEYTIFVHHFKLLNIVDELERILKKF